MTCEPEADFTMQVKDILENAGRQYIFVKETEDGRINVAAVDGARLVELVKQTAETNNGRDSAVIRIEDPDQEITLEPAAWLQVIEEVQSLISWYCDDESTEH